MISYCITSCNDILNNTISYYYILHYVTSNCILWYTVTTDSNTLYHLMLFYCTAKKEKPSMWSSDHVFASLQLRSAAGGTKEERDEFVIIRWGIVLRFCVYLSSLNSYSPVFLYSLLFSFVLLSSSLFFFALPLSSLLLSSTLFFFALPFSSYLPLSSPLFYSILFYSNSPLLCSLVFFSLPPFPDLLHLSYFHATTIYALCGFILAYSMTAHKRLYVHKWGSICYLLLYCSWSRLPSLEKVKWLLRMHRTIEGRSNCACLNTFIPIAMWQCL